MCPLVPFERRKCIFNKQPSHFAEIYFEAIYPHPADRLPRHAFNLDNKMVKCMVSTRPVYRQSGICASRCVGYKMPPVDRGNMSARSSKRSGIECGISELQISDYIGQANVARTLPEEMLKDRFLLINLHNTIGTMGRQGRATRISAGNLIIRR